MAGGSRARAPIRGGGDGEDAGVPPCGPPERTAQSEARHGLYCNGGAAPIWDIGVWHGVNTAVQQGLRVAARKRR